MVRLVFASLLLFLQWLHPSSSYSTVPIQTRFDEALIYCNCQYNIPYEDEAECRSYGQLGDGELIPWYRANQTCLDEYQIKNAAIDQETLLAICPYENSTDVDIQLLMNEIRYNPSPATRAIQASYSNFWTESNVTAGSYELVNVVSDGRNNPNCIESATLCWGIIREYFTSNVEATDTACKELHARNRFEMDLEQSTIRIRLCQEVDDGTTDLSSSLLLCEPLVTQIKEVKAMNPSKACSAFGLGPGTQELPTNCAATGTTNSQLTSSSRRTLNCNGLDGNQRTWVLLSYVFNFSVATWMITVALSI
jgi:hypothetical protein